LVAGSATAACIMPSIIPAATAPMLGRALRNVVLVIGWMCMAVPCSARQFSCHHSGRPPHARAPHAGRMTSFRQVSWLAGHDPPPPSRALSAKPSDIVEKGSPPTVAGAAPDLARCQRITNRTEFPFCRSTRPAHLNLTIANCPTLFVKPELYFFIMCDIPVIIV
jgi:hypothetical protein